MISSNQDYIDAMKEMIRKVQSGYEPPFNAGVEELEILSDCIKNGYIRGRTTYVASDGREHELRTLDGKMHPEIINHVIPPKGLAFLDNSSDNNKSNKPNEADGTKREHQSGKKFYQSGTFWTAVAIIVTIILWAIDRFYFGILP